MYQYVHVGDVQDGIIRSGGLDLLVKQIPSSSSDQLDKILTALVNISNNGRQTFRFNAFNNLSFVSFNIRGDSGINTSGGWD